MKAVLRNVSYLCTVDLHFSNDGIKKDSGAGKADTSLGHALNRALTEVWVQCKVLRVLYVFSVTFNSKHSLFSISCCIFARK